MVISLQATTDKKGLQVTHIYRFFHILNGSKTSFTKRFPVSESGNNMLRQFSDSSLTQRLTTGEKINAICSLRTVIPFVTEHSLLSINSKLDVMWILSRE